MTRKQIFVLVGCMLLGSGLLVSLFALSPIGDPISRQPFSRNFDSGIHLSKQAEIDLGFNSFYIAGATEKTVYLGNRTAPLYLEQISLPQLDSQHMILHIKGDEIPDDYTAFRLAVDSPYFYLTHGVMPGIFKGLLSSRKAVSFLPVNSPYFIEAVPVSPSLFALKSLTRESNVSELAALRPDSPYFEFKPEILVKQVDGIFCVNGKLHYDKSLNKLVYIYSYRNEYIVMDTSLNVINRCHTIDTFSRAPIKVAKVASKNYSTLASPPASTNLQSYVSDGLLFVQSPFLAKNEEITMFNKGSVFDTYDVIEGKYLCSFYIDHLNNRAPSSVIVTGPYVVAIFDQRLIIYKHNMNQLLKNG